MNLPLKYIFRTEFSLANDILKTPLVFQVRIAGLAVLSLFAGEFTYILFSVQVGLLT